MALTHLTTIFGQDSGGHSIDLWTVVLVLAAIALVIYIFSRFRG